MSKEGEVFINSRGRRLIRSIKIDRETKLTEAKEPFEEEGFESAEDFDSANYYVNLEDESQPRYGTQMFIKMLEYIRDEGPIDYSSSPDYRQDLLDWLIRNKYITFVPSNKEL